MSFTITLRVYQTNPNAYFTVVEKTVWNQVSDGTWSETDGVYKLTIGGTGTSGTIRFLSDTGERFIVAVGVDNYKRWCDIIPDLTADQTGVAVHPQYYNGGSRSDIPGRQLDVYTATSFNPKRKLEIKYTKNDGQALAANIVIG